LNQAILDILRCPTCHAALCSEDGRVCRCRGTRTHCFDFAKSGYLNLGGAHAGDGDLKAAVLARRAFLDAGFYQPLSDQINQLLSKSTAKIVLDAGSGEGYYTNRMAVGRDVLGVDLSRDGVDYAARRAKQTNTSAAFVVASLFALPIADRSLDAVVNIFAPCAEEEFARVLKSNGHLIVVAAGEHHLMGLKKAIYDNPYANPGRADLPTNMSLIQQENLRYEITVEGKELIEALFSMTPYYWRTSTRDKQKLAQLDRLITEVDFDIFHFCKEL